MSAGGYEDFLPTRGPSWLRGPWGVKLSRSIGKIMDDQNERMRSAVKVGQPDGAVALGMGDALDHQGDDRGLPRGGSAPNVIDETDASYASRLKAAWETYAQSDEGGGAGSVKGLLLQLGIAGFPLGATGAHVINHIGLSWWLDTGNVLRFDNMGVCVNRVDLEGTRGGLIGFTRDWQDQFFSRFVILFPANVPTLSNTDTPAKARLNSIVKQWKSGPAIYDGAIIVATDGRVFGYPSTYVFNNSDVLGQFDAYARYVDPE